MLGRIMNIGVENYWLFGIGVFGVVLNLLFGTYLKIMVKASENMSTTKVRSLRIIRQKFDNCKALGREVNSEAFLEKNVRKLKFIAMPIELWKKSARVLLGVVIMLMAVVSFWKTSSWIGTSDMYEFILSGIFICAFLMVSENIFLINNKVEILKANIRDYLAGSIIQRDRLYIDEPIIERKRVVENNVEAAAAAVDIEPSEEAKRPDNEEMLGSFLKEFFS